LSLFSSRSRGLEWLALALCAATSLILLSLPAERQAVVADILGRVLTQPYSRTSDFIADVGRMRLLNDELQARVTSLEIDRDSVLRLRRERDDLRRALGMVESTGGRLSPCEVVSREVSGYASLVAIRSGRDLQWRPYQPIITADGLVGRIRHVLGPRRAWVELLTAPDVALGCELSRTGLQGILRSRLGDFELVMIGRDEDVQVGDRIITSGVAEIGDDAAGGVGMPRGLPVGLVTYVASPPDQLFKEIRVTSLADFHRQEAVFAVFGGGDWFEPAAMDTLAEVGLEITGSEAAGSAMAQED